ncbi:MAG: transcriptional repressor [Nanoarchaeota archaeon]|nr:transcriptional repressor [Nanoarchaeota archaeon]
MKTRNTKQKELIQKEMDKFITFFTAEELYDQVKKMDNKIGLATIYRFLKRLRKLGHVYSYICDNKLIYSKEKKSHCHFVCEETGKVIHFDINSLDFLKDKIPGSITSFQIEVRGICKKCSKN